ncbi:neural cell adhesion molecule 2-like [Astatotilapia calliptera]|uniref:neural cell adhesion molecule 2-like n=1 Tax=Astatotilapia calliptera TaxID=8154 RepID=UPI000E404D32|nr:neural cell adhesion molecule 2-like [Astatotilapia calliptera]
MSAGTASLCSTLLFFSVFEFVSAVEHTCECRVVSGTKRRRRGISTEPISIIHLHVVPPDPKIITAESGQDITLTCRAPNSNIVKWSRADLVPQYVILYQDGDFISANQHPSFKNRVDLQDRQMKDGDVSLILKDVNTADSGTYVCRVFIEETRSWKNSIILHLIVPPDQKNITAESGQDVTLTCRAPNNNTKFIHWSKGHLTSGYVYLYQEGQFVPQGQNPSFKNRVDLQDRQMKDGDVSLILKDVTINDTGTYECKEAYKLEHRLRIRTLRSLLRIEPKCLPAVPGQDVPLTCQAPDNKPVTGVKWSREDIRDKNVFLYHKERFDTTNQHPFFKNRVDLKDIQMKNGDVSLILKNVIDACNGKYECHVFIEKTHSWKSIRTIRLGVVPPAQKNITAASGQDVTLTCQAPNNNIIVKWSRADLGAEYVLLYRDDYFVPENQHPSFKNRVDLLDREMKDGDVSLILKNVTINDTGTYECRVVQIGTKYLKRISIIHLHVVPPGQTGGQEKDGDNKYGGKKQDGVSRGRHGLIASLSVFVLLVGFCIYRCRQQQQSEETNQPPVDLQKV